MPTDDKLNGQLTQMLDNLTTLDTADLDNETVLLEKLASIYPTMNIDELQDKLTQMLFIADILSILQTQDEMGLNQGIGK